MPEGCCKPTRTSWPACRRAASNRPTKNHAWPDSLSCQARNKVFARIEIHPHACGSTRSTVGSIRSIPTPVGSICRPLFQSLFWWKIPNDAGQLAVATGGVDDYGGGRADSGWRQSLNTGGGCAPMCRRRCEGYRHDAIGVATGIRLHRTFTASGGPLSRYRRWSSPR